MYHLLCLLYKASGFPTTGNVKEVTTTKITMNPQHCLVMLFLCLSTTGCSKFERCLLLWWYHNKQKATQFPSHIHCMHVKHVITSPSSTKITTGCFQICFKELDFIKCKRSLIYNASYNRHECNMIYIHHMQ